MNSSINKVHAQFKLNGTSYNCDQLKALAYNFIDKGEAFEKQIGEFIQDWLTTSDTIKVKTSGSTGEPKTIAVKKQAMVNSAIATGEFFNLKSSDKALLCLPVKAISGKMMLVRAMVLGLELDTVAPKKSLKFNTSKHYDFCAMIPMQLQSCISQVSNIKQIIVGGAAVSNQLLKQIESVSIRVFETYGMTETVSHIAVKQLNNYNNVTLSAAERSLFKTLANVTVSQDERDCLVINAPHLSDEIIVTNDVVNLHSNSAFEWLGRNDNVINSGGIKLFPETIEQKLSGSIKQRFFIASQKDETLGEKLILIIENFHNKIDNSAFETLTKHEIPKEIYHVSKFIETASGKIMRKETLDSIKI